MKIEDFVGQSQIYQSDLISILSIFKKELDLALPEWTSEFFPDKMKKFHSKFFMFQVFNRKLKRLKGGPFLKKIIDDWDKKIEGKIKTKFSIFSGHDTSGLKWLWAVFWSSYRLQHTSYQFS
jgi:prostatic aicd phosphatase